ncbi:hypothetical protein Hanom_Chr10g00903541 [Helianthus anomalus]
MTAESSNIIMINKIHKAELPQNHSESLAETICLLASIRSRAFWWAQVSRVRSGLALRPTPRMTMVKKLVT